MKTTRKLLSVLLALVMVLALATTAFAEGTNDNTGKITVNNAVDGQTYTIYQILCLESFNTSTGSYAYKATTAWNTFVNSDAIKGVYLAVDGQGYVTWVEGANAADFAKLAKEYADTNSIDSQASTKASSTTVIFENLNLGYYLMDSTLGVLCSLDTTAREVTISEKNAAPENEKKVAEGSNYQQQNDASIGDDVTFQSTITAKNGAQNYVFHDEMTEGLTFNNDVSITLTASGTTTVVPANNYTVKTDTEDDCDFEVIFTQAFCDTLKTDDKIVITYSAKLNENALTSAEDDIKNNVNKSQLSYGDSSKTVWSETNTRTWKLPVFKFTYTGEDDSRTQSALAGAKFTLSKNSDGTSPIKFSAAQADDDGGAVYVVDPNGTITEIETNSTGKFTIKGLDSGTYYLTETAAPHGYNKLVGATTVVISDTGKINSQGSGQGVAQIEIENKTGTVLPDTGGIGTTIFYVVGVILVLGAGVLLITKKRTAKR